MPPVISVEHLSKAYKLGQIGTGTFAHDLNVWWAKVRGKPNPMLRIGEADPILTAKSAKNAKEELNLGVRSGLSTVLLQRRGSKNQEDSDTLWALKDINFTVEQGEVLGIIGRNGAGKSTLLKILSRVTAPTSGKIKVKGRVASLLEVGTGFHPELTGRENIYLNGAILGMNRREIDRKFDEIVNFAEVEKFIDTPVKRYSSGMYVRLAFAVAAHLEPEILVVDEVLAVGDAEFQKKCLGKMEDVAQEGRTVLFVSHNMASVEWLCTSSVVLSKGAIAFLGESKKGIAFYQSNNIVMTPVIDLSQHRKTLNRPVMELIQLRILNQNNVPQNIFQVGSTIVLEIEFFASEPVREPHFGIGIDNSLGLRICTIGTRWQGIKLPQAFQKMVVRCEIEETTFMPDKYFLKIALGDSFVDFDAIEGVGGFEISSGNFLGVGRIPSRNQGVIVQKSKWSSNSE